MRLLEYLTEAEIALGGRTYPKFNNIVILAGGSASGKGFVIDNALSIQGKVFDIDDLKGLVARNSKFDDAFRAYLKNNYTPKNKDLDARVSEILRRNLAPSDLNLKDPVDTSVLHFFTAFKDYDNKLKDNLFLSAAHTLRKPNVIFDVTMRNTDILNIIHKYVTVGGYSPKNVHLVWVLNTVEKALKQNTQRRRSVSDEIVRATHKGVAETMHRILNDFDTVLKSGAKVSDLIQGDVWIVPNLAGVDSEILKSKQGNSVITRLNKFQVKEAGKPLVQFSDLERKYFRNGGNLMQKIDSYTPDEVAFRKKR